MTPISGKWKWATAIAVLSVANLGCPGETLPDGGSGGGSGGAGGGSAGGGTAGGGSMGGGAGGGSAGGAAGGFADLDFVVARFNPDGGLDATFGDGGIARLDVGTATVAANREVLWSMAKDSTDRLLLFGGTKGTGARTDLDRVVLRLSADGLRDTAFSGTGEFRLNVGNTADHPRHGGVQADGKIVFAGYVVVDDGTTADGGLRTTNRGAVVRLDANGLLDQTFGDAGMAMPWPQAFDRTDGGPDGVLETYNAVLTPNGQYVTNGYGRTAGTGTVDQISVRLSSTGELDPSWNSNLGYFAFDLIGADDRGRNMVLLADGRAVVAGSAVPTAPGVLDAMVLVLTAGGQLDTTFNSLGYKLWNFNGADEPFYGVAVSLNGMQVAAAGWSGGGTNPNEDATLLLLPLMGGAPAEFAQKVPLSAVGNDRFWAVTWDANNRPVAAGFVNVGGDTQMAVARFTAQGSLDATFGGTGIVTLNVSAGRADETARAVLVQSNGKIVIAGVADH